MKMNETLIVPPFGMSGEKGQFVIINFNFSCIFINNFDELTVYLTNSNGIRIDFTITNIAHYIDSTLNNSNYNLRLKIIATIDFPDSSFLKLSDKNFDLILSEGKKVLTISKEAFNVYDSVAVLVHGVLSSPLAWEQLITSTNDKILYLKFDYEKKNSLPAMDHVDPFNIFIYKELREKGYLGRFDIVCHSMGAQITRLWMMNYPDNDNTHASEVRQWIGIGPVNHGSANADGLVADIISIIFNRPAFFQLKTKSTTTKLLINNEKKEVKNNVRYRVILGYNGKMKRFFYWWNEDIFIPKCILNSVNRTGITLGLPIPLSFNGKTKAYNPSENLYYMTYLGDGVVANCLSVLPYAQIDAFEGLNHSLIVRDRQVCNLVHKNLVDNPELDQNNNFAMKIEKDCQSHGFQTHLRCYDNFGK